MGEPDKVLICSFVVLPDASGASRRVTEYLRGLAGHFQVDVLTAGRADRPHVEGLHGARLLRVPVGDGEPGPWREAQAQAFERAVRRQVQAGEYALVHVVGPVGAAAVCEERAAGGYRLVFEATTLPSEELLHGDPRTRAWLRRQELHGLTNADLVLTGAPTSAARLRTLGAEPDRVAVLRAPAPVTAGAPRLRTGAGLHVGCFVGSPATHDTELLLDALTQGPPEVRLTLLASGATRPELAARVTARGLDARVRVLQCPAHAQLAEALGDLDLGVVPLRDCPRNRTHGAPLPAASELLAAGLPVLAADLPVCRALLPPGGAAFYAPSDAGSLVGALQRLVQQDRRGWNSMGRAACAYAAETLDSAVVTAQLRAHYAACLRGVTPPPAEAPLQHPAPAMSHPADSADVIELGDEDLVLHEEPEAPAPRAAASVPMLEAVEEFAPPPPPEPAPWPSHLDGWYAQAVHGYCPPVVPEPARPVVRPPALPGHARLGPRKA